MKYDKLNQWIIEKIKDETFLPNSFLPTENQLQKKYNISKMTVRRAMEELKKMGLVCSIHGKGVIVSPFSNLYLSLNENKKLFKKIILPTSAKIPNFLINDNKHKINLYYTNEENWFPFLTIYFKDNFISHYKVNWFYLTKKHQNLSNYYKDYLEVEKLFEIEKSIKKTSIIMLEELIENDYNIFAIEKNNLNKILPIKYDYFISSNGKVNKISITRFLPSSFELII